MPRLFFAIPVPIKVRKYLVSCFPPRKESFGQKNFSGIRFTPEENIHITTHFLGATPDAKIPEIIQSGKEISLSASSIEFKFDSVKTVFKDKKPVMIWIQFEENTDFETLCQKYREAFPTDERRKPLPHLTLARIRQLKKLPFDLPHINRFSFIADRVELWKSNLQTDGAQYEQITSWMFPR